MRIIINEQKILKDLIEQRFNVKMDSLPTAITIDSRLHKPGDIYLAISGKRYDGHNFIKNIINNRPSLIISEKKLKYDIAKIETSNNIKILNELVSLWRKKINLKVIGITGSNGKTTTKELAYHVISKSIECFKTRKNYNTVLSSPLSFLSAKKSQKVAIIEMGTNQPGEIDSICKALRPEVGLITNISNAHFQNFISEEEIANEKGSLFNALPMNGIALVNNDDYHLRNLKINAKKITYGFKNKVDFQASIVNENTLLINDDKINLPASGFPMAQNALAVYALASTMGINRKQIINRISSFILPKGRGQIINIKGINILDDSYNANPTSMLLGLNRFTESQGKRKIAILGDMFELGEQEEASHVKIAKFLLESSINVIITTGMRMKLVHNHIKNKKKSYWFESKREIIEFINKNKKNGDNIYIKGSRGMKMEKIITGIC